MRRQPIIIGAGTAIIIITVRINVIIITIITVINGMIAAAAIGRIAMESVSGLACS